MKAPHPFFNWPSLTLVLGILVQLPLLLAYTKLGPKGLDDARSQLTSGMWFLFGGAYMLAASRAAALAWMLRFFSKPGAHEGETRVRMVLLGGLCAVIGAVLFVRGVVLSNCHFDGVSISCVWT